MMERSCLVIASPRPVPSMLLVFLRSRRSKGSKRRSISSGRMPMPVSVTQTLKRIESDILSSSFIMNSTRPASVYFTAFVSRFVIICLTRISSPSKTDGSSGSMLNTSSSPFASARNCTRLYRSTTTDLTEYSSFSMLSFPFSILEKSRMSLIMPRRLSPAFRIFSEYSRITELSVSRCIISFMPSIAVMGVRISWLMFERKALFAVFACSACLRAEVRFLVLSFSSAISLISVTSSIKT